MARSAEEILREMGPAKSKARYEKSWTDFVEFLDTNSKTNSDSNSRANIPTEEDYLSYFDYLHRIKEWKFSTIWSTFSKLNGTHSKLYGSRLQQWPRIQTLLKSYAHNYQRKKASAFTHEEILEFLNSPLDTAYWLLRKAAVSISYCGGLRGCELRSLNVADLELTNEGVWITFNPGKARGEVVSSKFLVPFSDQPDENMGIHVRRYLDQLKKLQLLQGELLKTVADKNNTFLGRPMGKNTLAKIGVDVAQMLGLDEPNKYTGHTFRRTAARRAADAGANLVQLKRHFNWQGDNVAMQYIDGSTHHSKKMAKMIAGGSGTSGTSGESKAVDKENQNAGEGGGITTNANANQGAVNFSFNVAKGGSVVINNYAAPK